MGRMVQLCPKWGLVRLSSQSVMSTANPECSALGIKLKTQRLAARYRICTWSGLLMVLAECLCVSQLDRTTLHFAKASQKALT